MLALQVTSVNGIAVTTDMYARDGEGHTKSNVAKIGGGAAVGALLGGIFGGGKGAAIGAVAGGGAGTVGAAATGKKEAKIDAESTLTFTVQ
jgi:outer membrane lipoprotein SlyB